MPASPKSDDYHLLKSTGDSIKRLTTLTAMVALAMSTGLASAQDKPAELKIGISTFTSGPASVFGVPVSVVGRRARRKNCGCPRAGRPVNIHGVRAPMLKQRRSRRGRARNTKTMLTCRLLPSRLTEPEIGRSVLPPCRLMD